MIFAPRVTKARAYDPDPLAWGYDPQPLPPPRIRRGRCLTPLGLVALLGAATGVVSFAAFMALSRIAEMFVP